MKGRTLHRLATTSLMVLSIVAVASLALAAPDPAPVFAAAQAAQPAPGTPRELLPELGQIGAEVALLGGVATSPFKADRGTLIGAVIDLPIAKAGSGKLSYEIAITNQRANTDVRITSPLSAVGDLLAADGLGNTLTSKTLSSLKNLPAKENFDVLAVLPFGLKYTILSLDHARVRPYVVGSMGVYVTISKQDPSVTADARLAGAFIGGISPESPELTARGMPSGQGDIRLGGNIGGGLEVRAARRASIGVEYRFHAMQGANAQFSTVVGKLGLHF